MASHSKQKWRSGRLSWKAVSSKSLQAVASYLRVKNSAKPHDFSNYRSRVLIANSAFCAIFYVCFSSCSLYAKLTHLSQQVFDSDDDSGGGDCARSHSRVPFPCERSSGQFFYVHSCCSVLSQVGSTVAGSEFSPAWLLHPVWGLGFSQSQKSGLHFIGYIFYEGLWQTSIFSFAWSETSQLSRMCFLITVDLNVPWTFAFDWTTGTLFVSFREIWWWSSHPHLKCVLRRFASPMVTYNCQVYVALCIICTVNHFNEWYWWLK